MSRHEYVQILSAKCENLLKLQVLITSVLRQIIKSELFKTSSSLNGEKKMKSNVKSFIDHEILSRNVKLTKVKQSLLMYIMKEKEKEKEDKRVGTQRKDWH